MQTAGHNGRVLYNPLDRVDTWAQNSFRGRKKLWAGLRSKAWLMLAKGAQDMSKNGNALVGGDMG